MMYKELINLTYLFKKENIFAFISLYGNTKLNSIQVTGSASVFIE